MSTQYGKPNFFDRFIDKPLLAAVLSFTLVMLGLRAAINMPVLEFPQIESSSLVITTPYVGASAETVQGFVTDPIERAVSSLSGIDYVESSTTAGLSSITVWLELNVPSAIVLAELSSRLGQIRFELPQGAEDPSVQVQRADASDAVFYLAVDLGERSIGEVTDYLDREVLPTLSAVPGVQYIDAQSNSPAMRVWLNPEKMNFFGISAQQVRSALTANNVIAAIGSVENPSQRLDLRLDSTLKDVEGFKQLVVSNKNGKIVRLSDIARVAIEDEEGSSISRQNLRDTIFLGVYSQPGANELEMGNALYKKLDEINKALPKNMQVLIDYDGTVYMRSALREIFITLAETVLLVGLVVLAFVGSLRSALVPLITIPISLLGAIAVIMTMGFSFNLLTILAIVLSVGLVVDDAIVVVENVGRFMRQGMSKTEAALASSRQLLTPIIGMTLTLAAVYIPIGYLSGLTGVLVREFAITLAVAVLMSGIVALTLSPIMSAHSCPPKGKEGRVTLWVNRRFNASQKKYDTFLGHCLNWTPQVLFFGLFFSLLTIPFLLFSQQELAPIEDENIIFLVIESPADASLDYTASHMPEVVNVMNALPGASDMFQLISPSGGFGGQQFIPQNQRSHSTQALVEVVSPALSAIPGINALPNLFPSLPSSGNFAVEMIVTSGESAEEMEVYAQKLVQAAYQTGEFLFAETDLKIDLPLASFKLHRDRITDLGLQVEDVSQQLSLFLSGYYVNRFDLNGKAYRVTPMLEDANRLDPKAVLKLQLQTPDGLLVPFSSVASFEDKVGPRVLTKFQQRQSFSIYGGIRSDITKEQALTSLERAAAEILPPGYQIDYGGESRQIRQEGNSLFGALAFALVCVFLVLMVLFNSIRDPLVVLLGCVPLALSGAMMFTFLDLTTINIYSQIGFITLVGLVAKNGILVVEFSNHLRDQGMDKLSAIKAGASTRLRPILMTAGATIVGHFPLVLVSGAGAEARNSIGIILVAGMLIGTLLTLFILPSVYMALASDRHSNK